MTKQEVANLHNGILTKLNINHISFFFFSEIKFLILGQIITLKLKDYEKTLFFSSCISYYRYNYRTN
ncbi:hypothetical protein B739_1331 [Riemerella anatipestifer RA-CH-1]|uniref:Uncharacterized protein n=1 Tax=Riemerella anatipestifer RA-CH-1 TaxID=1228997 RepID=J9R299_RIEAN|nr:hypothetical protein B739_1331 [Riemerella anatipestifer RA-CH-1]AIH02927.1 hypothetical protein M949_1760 [Riemerella anatipestifer CH3]